MRESKHFFGRAAFAWAAAFIGLSASAANGTWVKRDGVGTGGTDWTPWAETANWDGGIVASGTAYTANLGTAQDQYVRLPDTTVNLKNLGGCSKGYTVLCGNALLAFGSPADNVNYCHLYTPWSWKHNNYYSSFNGVSVCADAKEVSSSLMLNGTRIRLDRYANSSDPVRHDACLPKGHYARIDGSSSLYFMAPAGSAAKTSAWRQTAGSAFFAPKTSGGVLSAGTIVTGTGIPANTFLKRIFPDGAIELSNAATTTSDNNSLTFAAFTPDASVRLGAYQGYNVGGLKGLVVEKYREQDAFRVEIGYFGKASGTVANHATFRVYTESGFVPGIISLYTERTDEAVLQLENTYLEFNANYPNLTVSMPTGEGCVANLAVTGTLSKAIGTLSDMKGTMVKRGTGTLTAGVADGAFEMASSRVVIEEGTFEPTVPEGYGLDLYDVTIKAGAALKIFEGLRIINLHVEKGAIITGPATLKVANLASGSLEDIVAEGGAIILDPQPTGGNLHFSIVSGEAELGGTGDSSLFFVREGASFHVTGEGTFDVLLVGGGGGGGSHGGGGGGGGGVVYREGISVSEGVYSISVGSGGGIATTGYGGGQNGGATYAFGLTAHGGGGGGMRGAGKDGSSGGGGGAPYFVSTTTYITSPGRAIYGDQGYDGGSGTNSGARSVWQVQGGGGGGAGGPGQNSPSTSRGGDGGIGRICNITGGDVYYGGGGGGGSAYTSMYPTKGGLGGGGRGSGVATYPNCYDAEAGTDGVGGGGGGGASAGDGAGHGGNGGSGIAIIRYRPATPEGKDLPIRGMLVPDVKCRYRGGYEMIPFSENGTVTLTSDAIVDLFLVGGGGGGGTHAGGGGGGGGFRVLTNVFLYAGTYDVVVGEGGAGGVSSAGASGGDTYFLRLGDSGSSLLAQGGGGGGMRETDGKDGGSGGGGGARYFATASVRYAPGGKGAPGQGHDGGMSTNDVPKSQGGGGDHWQSGGGGGGGAGMAGVNAKPGRGGRGGDGLPCDFLLYGTNTWYAGGGGGGSDSYQGTDPYHYDAEGGRGGGGHGSAGKNESSSVWYGLDAEDGTDGIGGGGGGAGSISDNSGKGGRGGRGFAAIRWKVRSRGWLIEVR